MKVYIARLLAIALHGFAAIAAAAPQPADPKEKEAIAYCEKHSSAQIRLVPTPDGRGGWKAEACVGTVCMLKPPTPSHSLDSNPNRLLLTHRQTPTQRPAP